MQAKTASWWWNWRTSTSIHIKTNISALRKYDYTRNELLWWKKSFQRRQKVAVSRVKIEAFKKCKIAWSETRRCDIEMHGSECLCNYKGVENDGSEVMWKNVNVFNPILKLKRRDGSLHWNSRWTYCRSAIVEAVPTWQWFVTQRRQTQFRPQIKVHTRFVRACFGWTNYLIAFPSNSRRTISPKIGASGVDSFFFLFRFSKCLH